MSYIISETTVLIFAKFVRLLDLSKCLRNRAFILLHSGDIAMTTYFKGNIGEIDIPVFVAVAFRNGLEYQNADGRINTANDLPTLCTNLVNLGLLTLLSNRLGRKSLR